MIDELSTEPKPMSYAEIDKVYRNLRKLKDGFGDGYKRRDRAEVLIGACILEGFDTAYEIRKALGSIGLSPDFVIHVLHARTGSMPGEYLWQHDAKNRYRLLEML